MSTAVYHPVKDSIKWTANQEDAKILLKTLGARNLNCIKSGHYYNKATQFKIVKTYQGPPNDKDVKKWMRDQIKQHTTHEGPPEEQYLYFRFIKY